MYESLMHLLFLAATTLLISFDGLRPDQITPQRAPHIYQFKQQGASAKYMEPTFPTSTFPNHASIITGCTAEEHGIVSNHFFDAKMGKFSKDNRADWIECEPLWAALNRQGKRIAIYVWPTAETPWRGERPDYLITYKEIFGKKDFSKKWAHESAEYQQILNWLKLPKNKRPDFIAGYFPAIDAAGHKYGPFAVQSQRVIHSYDELFGQFLKELEESDLLKDLNIVLVSDHGMALGTKPVSMQPQLDQIKEKYYGDFWKIAFSAETIVNIYLKDKREIGKIVAEFNKIPHIRAYSAEGPQVQKFPKHWHYQNPRSGDIVLVVDPPYFMNEPPVDPRKRKKGYHGYDPDHPDMRAFFAARGPDFKKIELDKILTIDIAPTLAKIMGVSLDSKKSGRAVTAVLK